MESILSAVSNLLDANKRSGLWSEYCNIDSAMDDGGDEAATDTEMYDDCIEELELWLLSLMASSWLKSDYDVNQLLELSSKAVTLGEGFCKRLSNHRESLFPLLARLYRFQNLAFTKCKLLLHPIVNTIFFVI